MVASRGIGLAIGDEWAVAVGVADGLVAWVVSEPAVVAAPSAAARVELLLAGAEAVAAGTEPLLTAPRRWGYVPGDAAVARELLAALLATLRQQVPPGALAAARVVLALPFAVPAAAAEVLAQAAADAGWGDVVLVSEAAAASAAGVTSVAGGAAPVLVSTGALVDDAPAAPVTEQVARGSAVLAALGGLSAVTLVADRPLWLGLEDGRGGFLPLAPADQPGRWVRALRPPGPAGAVLRLLAGSAEQGAQLLAEVTLPAGGAGEQPWLLTVELTAAYVGRWSVGGAGAGLPAGELRVRLP